MKIESENNQIVLQKIKKVIEFLGFNIVYENISYEIRLTAKNNIGYEFCISYSEYTKEKLHISGIYPKNKKGEYITIYENNNTLFDKSINISINKEVEKIAKDITNRFLPDYIKRYNLVIDRIKEQNNYYDNKERILSELYHYCYNKTIDNRDIERGEFSLYNLGRFGEVKNVSDNKVKIEVDDLTIEQAKEILALIKKYKSDINKKEEI